MFVRWPKCFKVRTICGLTNFRTIYINKLPKNYIGKAYKQRYTTNRFSITYSSLLWLLLIVRWPKCFKARTLCGLTNFKTIYVKKWLKILLVKAAYIHCLNTNSCSHNYFGLIPKQPSCFKMRINCGITNFRTINVNRYDTEALIYYKSMLNSAILSYLCMMCYICT